MDNQDWTNNVLRVRTSRHQAKLQVMLRVDWCLWVDIWDQSRRIIEEQIWEIR